MQMGTGKTRIALELVNYNKVDLLIFICPFSAIKNIQAEFEKWGVNCEYIIAGHESISQSDKKYLEILKKVENKRCFIVADESIFIKNETSKRFERLCNIREKCEYALILNGTPLTKSEWDLYNQMYFLSPLIINMNRSQFLYTFFKCIRYKRKGEREHTFFKFSEVNAEALHKMIEPYIFQADLEFEKEEKEYFYFVGYSGTEYNQEKERQLEEIKKGMYRSDIVINMLTSLNVIASNYERKCLKVAEYIKNKQVIVFCNFMNEIEIVKKSTDCFVITGSTKNRHEIIEKFKNSQKPLIMTFGVGSYSLNLQFCNEIVYSSVNFDFGKIEQSKYRIKRIGQERDIKYTYFLTDLGITRFILKNLDKKTSLKKLVESKISEGDYKWIKSL